MHNKRFFFFFSPRIFHFIHPQRGCPHTSHACSGVRSYLNRIFTASKSVPHFCSHPGIAFTEGGDSSSPWARIVMAKLPPLLPPFSPVSFSVQGLSLLRPMQTHPPIQAAKWKKKKRGRNNEGGRFHPGLKNIQTLLQQANKSRREEIPFAVPPLSKLLRRRRPTEPLLFSTKEIEEEEEERPIFSFFLSSMMACRPRESDTGEESSPCTLLFVEIVLLLLSLPPPGKRSQRSIEHPISPNDPRSKTPPRSSSLIPA